jgi:hypothetical protein
MTTKPKPISKPATPPKPVSRALADEILSVVKRATIWGDLAPR